MRISILTLFPQMFSGPFSHSIVNIAQEKNLVEIHIIDIRQFGLGTHKTVDDSPYGGGVGMVMKVDVLHNAIIQTRIPHLTQDQEKVVLMTADGIPFTQPTAKKYAGLEHLIILCGHYEGVDERVRKYIDEEVSIGDFVLTGGEIPAMLITDAVTRLIKGVLKEDATSEESFSLASENEGKGNLEYPIYTRPVEYGGEKVPDILLSGDHKKIEVWRKEQSHLKTLKKRPDLLS